MSHHCPFPVRSSDSRCGYRSGSVPCLTLCIALVAALACFAGLSHAAPAAGTALSHVAPSHVVSSHVAH